MGFLLEVTASKNQLISGIPEYVDIESSRTALYFYTLDGTDPDLDSLIAVDRIYLPTSGNSVTLKVIAYDEYDSDTGEDHFSEIITLNYYTNLDIKNTSFSSTSLKQITNKNIDNKKLFIMIKKKYEKLLFRANQKSFSELKKIIQKIWNF